MFTAQEIGARGASAPRAGPADARRRRNAGADGGDHRSRHAPRRAPVRRDAGVFGNGGERRARRRGRRSAAARRGRRAPSRTRRSSSAREPAAMAEAARRLEAAGAELIDINMGCPARRVAGRARRLRADARSRRGDAADRSGRARGRGAGHASRPGSAGTTTNATPPTLARRAEAAGVAMITVHGRTRCQFYDGEADWRAVGEVVAAVGVPVVVNGDCRSADDARAMLAQSGARAVMIGRAAIGAPWLRRRDRAARLIAGGPADDPPAAERRAAALAHVEWLLARAGPARRACATPASISPPMPRRRARRKRCAARW